MGSCVAISSLCVLFMVVLVVPVLVWPETKFYECVLVVPCM